MRHTHYIHLLLTSLSLIAPAAAHGYIANVTVDGTPYKGNDLAQNEEKPFASVIRQKYSASPVLASNLTSRDIICGVGADKPASDVAPVNAGDTISIAYTSDGDGSHWIHEEGPVLTYLADCGDIACNKFDATTASWFKIDQQGKNATGDWPVQAGLFAGNPATVTIPANLRSGNYLLRHEIVALHAAQTEGKAEFYPNCVQVKVIGKGNATRTTEELVSFPGAYRETDPDMTYDVYSDKTAPYICPGPRVAAFIPGGGSEGCANAVTGSSSTSNSAPST
ncbi:glycoside hydrolase family 61 protein, partial [Mycena polygramma]